MAKIPKVALAVGLSVLLLLASPGSTSANAGPAEWAAADYGGTLVPVKSDSISVLSEHLVLGFAGATHYDHGITLGIYRFHSASRPESDPRVAVFWPVSHQVTLSNTELLPLGAALLCALAWVGYRAFRPRRNGAA